MLGIIDYGGLASLSVTDGRDVEQIRQNIRESMELHREAGFTEVFMPPMVILLMYPSKVGTVFNYRDGRIDLITERFPSFRRLTHINQTTDPLQLAVEEAHRVGLKFWAGYRMNDNVMHSFWNLPKEIWSTIQADFVRDNPQFQIQSPDPDRGIELVQPLSYAFPEVRKYTVDMLVEMAAYPIDGLVLDFMRFEYVAGYDEPALAAFAEQYGGYPSDLDERWWRIRAGYVIELVRELKGRLQEIGKPNLPIAIRLPITSHTTYMRNKIPQELRHDPVAIALYMGFDIQTLAAEGLIDRLILGDIKQSSIAPYPLGPIVDLVSEYPVEIIAGFQDENMGYNAYQKTPEELHVLFQMWSTVFRDAGVDGFAVYESEAVIVREEVRKILRELL